MQVVKLQHRSVVPADVQWLSGDALLCDSSFAAQGDVYRGAGGDTGRDSGDLVRLYGGQEDAAGSGQNGQAAAHAAAQARAAAASGGGGAEGLRQRKPTTAKKDKAPPTVVGGVTIEEASSDDEDHHKGIAKGAAENPYADLPTVNEVGAGALVLDTGRGPSGEAVCRVVRVGAASAGWQRAARVRDDAAHWRRAKRPSRPAHLGGAWSTLLVGVVVGCAVPASLHARAVQGPPKPLLALVAAFFGSLQRAVEDATGLALADLLPKLSWPGSEMPDDVTFGEEPNGNGAAAASGGSGGNEAGSSNDGMVALTDLVSVRGMGDACLWELRSHKVHACPFLQFLAVNVYTFFLSFSSSVIHLSTLFYLCILF